MITKTLPQKSILLSVLMGVTVLLGSYQLVHADEPKLPQPILLNESKESLDERLLRKIALDVRDMNIVDVLKFLAMKGEFNIIISPSVDGRTTVLLENVGIKDAMDIVVVSNRLAYTIQKNIIQVMTAVEYEAMFGKSFGDKTVVETMHLQYAKPSYVLAALDNVKSNVGKIIIDEDTGSLVMIDTPEAIESMKKVMLQIEKPLETIVYNLQYAKADVVADKLRTRIDAKSVGSITADERSNQLVIRAFPGRKDEIERTIRHLDEPTKEVMIEARILAVTLKPSYEAGIDWANVDADKGRRFGRINTGNGGPDLVNPSTGERLANVFGQVGVGTVNVDNFIARIRTLEGVSNTKMLASPQLMAVNNQESRIHIGDTVPYIISTTVGTADPVTSEDVRFIDVGLKLNVTPTINDDGMVSMKLRPEISAVTETVDSERGGIPQVTKTEVETTVIVQNGMTIVLAGLRKDEKTHSKAGVPFLKDIPLAGQFFSSESEGISTTEIVMFITPTIMTGKENYKAKDGTIKPSKAYN